jgi:hypothetical protein
MNKAVAAGIGVVIVLIAIAALYMMNQTDESATQVDLSENVEMTAEESDTESYQVELGEGIQVGDKPP